jgi:hypothetical protein
VLGVFGFGLGFHGAGIYLRTIVDTLVSAAVTIHFLAAAAIMPALAILYRRFGVAQITKLGALTLAWGCSAGLRLMCRGDFAWPPS